MKNSKFSLKRLLFVLATLAVCSRVGATDVEFDVKDGSASQYSDFLGQTVNVTLKNRTFTAGEWTGVCFPFSATKEQLDATFGEGKYTIEEFSSIVGTTVNFTIMSTPAVVAGTPYIMKTNTTLSNPTFGGVTFANSLDTWLDISVASDLSFRGFYFKIYDWQLVNGQSSPANAWWIANGTLQNYLAKGITYSESGRLGSGAFFFSSSKGNVALTLSLEQPTNSGSGGEGGESGGGGSQTTYTDIAGTTKLGLQTRIANREQLTDVPTIYLDIPEVTNINNDLAKVVDPETGDTKYFKATIQVVDNSEVGSAQHLESFTETELEIKVRGNSTSTAAKRPYRLKFAKKHKHDLLGLGYEKRNWTLLANAFDGSMMRNAVTYHIGKYVGLDEGAGFCPGYKFVDLVINGDYRGTYQVSDHVQVDGDRININEDTDWFVEGVSWKSQAEEPYVGDEPSICIKNPEPATEEELNTLKGEVSEWRTKWLAAFDSMDPNTGWQGMNDVESFIKYYTAINLTGDIDGWFVFKGYRTPTGPFFWGPLWDKDLAFGNWHEAAADKLVEFYNKCNFEWKIQALLSQRAFVLKAKECIDNLIAGGLYEKLAADIDRIAGILEQTQQLNYQLYDIKSMGSGSVIKDTYTEYVQQLKDYIKARITFVQSELQKYIEALPAATEETYDPEKYWYGTGLLQNKEYNLSVKNRTLTGGQWNTFCLPFAATEEQMKSALGCNYELAVHSGMDGETMLFSAPESLDIQAGVPYLIKPASNVTSFGKFNNVFYTLNVTNQTGIEFNGYGVTFDNKHYFYASLFHGYELSTKTDFLFNSDLFTTNDASFAKTTIDNQSGCRAYIRVTDGSTPSISFATAEPVVRTQLADVPTIYIDTQDGAEIQPSTGEYVKAAIEVLDKNNMIGGGFTETSSYLQVRGRGKTEWAVKDGKKSYRLKFDKDEKDADGNVTTSHKHDLTNGGYAKRNWILLANAADESLVRNALADELGQAMGFAFTPKYQHVDLYINNVYQGTYLATDHVEADNEDGTTSYRVNVDEKQGWLLDMTNQDGIATGDVYVEGGESYPYINIKNPEPGKKTGTEDEIKAKVKTFFDALWAAEDGSGLDKKSFVNWYIATEILGNASALNGIYAYKENDDAELKFGPLWGNELALGNSLAYNAMVYESADASVWKSKLAALWQQNWFKNAVKTRWAELYKSGENDLKATMLTKFAALKTAVGKSHDGAKANEITEIETYLSKRFEYLNTKFAELTQTTALVGDVNGDGSANVTDIMAIAQHILGKTPAVFDTVAADVDENGSINVNDIMKLVTIILEKE